MGLFNYQIIEPLGPQKNQSPPRCDPPISQRLSDVYPANLIRTIEVGDGPRDPADAVPGAGGQVQAVGSIRKQPQTLGIRGGDIIQ